MSPCQGAAIGDHARMSAVLPCPVCKRPVAIEPGLQPASFPFCSARCRTVDLGAWASGSYVVPGRPVLGEGAEDVNGRDHA